MTMRSATNTATHIEQANYFDLRERLIAFYDQYMYLGDPENDDHLFTHRDKTEALAFFDGSGEAVGIEELTLRRMRSLMILDQTKEWARTQKRRFLYRLHNLDIALDRKKSLEKQFFAGSFQQKCELMQLLMSEENRITSKKLVQLAEQESYKTEFFSFYETHSIYFCYEDRILAWKHVTNSLEQFRTHKGKMDRLKLLLAMLPSNLIYARELDQKYQQLLNTHIENATRKEQCLEAFRQCTFKYKLERIEEIAKTDSLETMRTKTTEKQQANLILYQTLYAVFPHGHFTEEFAHFPLGNQDKIIAKKQETNAAEEVLLQELLQMDAVTTKEIIIFRQKSLAEKKLYLRTRAHKINTNQMESTTEKKHDPLTLVRKIKPQRIFQIAVTELSNEDQRKLHTNKEFVQIIQAKMSEQEITGNVDLTFVDLVAAKIQNIPKEQRKTDQFLASLEEDVCRTLYVGESRIKSHDSATRTSIQQLAQAA